MSRKKRKNKTEKLGVLIFLIFILIGIYIFIDFKYPLVCIDAGHGGKDVRVYTKK